MATPASDMWFPTPDELVAANVLTGNDIVVAGSGGRKAGASRAESLSEQRLRADLQAEAARTNKTAPIRIDSLTTLDRAQAAGYTLTSFYTVKLKNLNVAASRPGIAAALRRDVCGNPDMAAAVGDGARFAFAYRDASGRPLFDVSITHCPSPASGL